MATLNTKGMTLVDIAAGIGGLQPELVDALTGQDAGALFRLLPMRQVAGWVEKFTRKTGRPTVAFRALESPVTPSKAQKEAWQEGLFLLSGASEIDKQKADRDPRGVEAYRMEEDLDYLEAMGYMMSHQTFYGANATDGGFDGLQTRLSSSEDTYVTADGTGGAYTSIYAIKFGPKRFMGLFNLAPGGDIIQATNYGAVIDKDSNGDLNEMYVTFFNAGIGIAQYHPKAIGRLALITASAKPTIAKMNDLFSAMGWMPDVLVTTMKGKGYLDELTAPYRRMGSGEKSFDIRVGDYDGIPIITDSALSDAETS